MKKTIYIFLFFFTNIINTNAQMHIVESPVFHMNCDSNCVMLHAVFSHPKQTTQYIVSPIPYTPDTLNNATNISIGDDNFSSAIPIGFTFCFYGNSYSQCYISSNGQVTFNPIYSNHTCSFNTSKPLPYFDTEFPDNAIFGPFMDIKPSLGGSIKYQTKGTVPNRKFVVEYNNVKLFGGNLGTCANVGNTFQIVLNETSNKIENYITNKSLCGVGNTYLDTATMGIQSAGAMQFKIVPSRNASSWTASNEGWRYSPAGADDYNMTWSIKGTNYIYGTNVDSIHICNPILPLTIEADYSLLCTGVGNIDTVEISKYKPIITNIAVVQPYCLTDTNGSITVIGSSTNPPIKYSLNATTFSNNNYFPNLGAQYYTITIRDANHCIADSLFQISPISQLKIAVDTLVFEKCPHHDGIIVVHGFNGMPPYHYLWSTGDTTNALHNLVGGTVYAVTVTDALGCSTIKSIYLDQDSIPTVSAVITKSICHNANGSINLTVLTGLPNFTYFWSNGATTQNLTNVTAGMYAVSVTDANGCKKNATYVIVDTLTTQLILNGTQPSCGLNNGVITAFAFGGLNPITILWNNGFGTSQITNQPPGIYYCTATDALGCTSVSQIILNNSIAPSLQMAISNEHCAMPNGQIITTIANASSPINYVWSNGAANSPNNVGLYAGTYYLTVTSSNGCVLTSTAIVNADPVPHLIIVSYQPPLCHGDSTGHVELTGFSGISPYKYSIDGTNFSSNVIINNISGGTYTVYIRDASSCVQDTVVVFSQPSAISTTLPKLDTLVCYTDVLNGIILNTTGATPPYEYRLLPSIIFVHSSMLNNLAIGTHTVEVQDSNFCLQKISFTVEGPTEALAVKDTITNLLCRETNTGAVSATIQGGWMPYTYTWSNGASGLFLNNLIPQKLTLQVTDSKGCKVNEPIEIKKKQCCEAFVPSAFSPNGDTRNDVLEIFGADDATFFEFSVFDRTGARIFFTTDMYKLWDGTQNGKPVNNDTYYYMLRYFCPYLANKVLQTGDITVVR